MDRILRLERELRINGANIRRLEGLNSDLSSHEYRVLIIQRSNLKDMLLDEYRKELLERREDIMTVTGEEEFERKRYV